MSRSTPRASNLTAEIDRARSPGRGRPERDGPPPGKEGPPPPASLVRLNREITAKSTAREILSLCKQHVSEFDAVNVVTGLHRIAKSDDSDQIRNFGSVIKQVFAHVLSLLTVLRPQQLGNTLWAISRINILHQPLLDALSSQSLPKIRQFEAQEISNSLWALARRSFED